MRYLGRKKNINGCFVLVHTPLLKVDRIFGRWFVDPNRVVGDKMSLRKEHDKTLLTRARHHLFLLG